MCGSKRSVTVSSVTLIYYILHDITNITHTTSCYIILWYYLYLLVREAYSNRWRQTHLCTLIPRLILRLGEGKDWHIDIDHIWSKILPKSAHFCRKVINVRCLGYFTLLVAKKGQYPASWYFKWPMLTCIIIRIIVGSLENYIFGYWTYLDILEFHLIKILYYIMQKWAWNLQSNR